MTASTDPARLFTFEISSGTMTESIRPWQKPPSGRTVMSHAGCADKLLIKPAGGPGRPLVTGRHVIGKARPQQQTASLSTSHSGDRGQPGSDYQAALRSLTVCQVAGWARWLSS